MTAKPRLSAKEIGRDVAAIGALLEGTEEYRAIVNSAARAIREERKGAVHLTKGEATAVLEAIGQMTIGNGGDYQEWRSQTNGTINQWRALLRAEEKIRTITLPSYQQRSK